MASVTLPTATTLHHTKSGQVQIFMLISIAFLLSLVIPNYSFAGWYNPSWNYRKSHVITGSSGAGADYQVRVITHKATGTDTGPDVYLGTGTNVKDDFGDVRFTASDGFTPLNYWLETGSLASGSVATFWVKVAADLGSSQTIYVYYGNTAATTTSSGTNTFILFDDFTGSSLDGTKWTQFNGGTPSFGSSLMTISANADPGKIIATGGPTANNNAIGARFEVTAGTNVGERAGVGVRTNTTDGRGFNYVFGNGTTFTSHNNFSFLDDAVAWGTVTPYAWSLSTFYIFEALHDGANVRGRINYGATWYTQAWTTRTGYLALNFGSYPGTTTVWDWAFIRKCITTEPAHSTWGTQESAPANIYVWTHGTSDDWTVGANWTPTRSIPAATDILQFNGGGSVTVTNVPAQTVAQALVSNSSTVHLQAGTTGNTLTVTDVLTTSASGDVLDLGNGLVLGGALTILTNTGKIQTAVPSSTSATPIPASRTWGGTVEYNGTGAQTVVGGTYTTLKINNTAGATLGAVATVTNLTIGDVTANSIFSDGGFQVTGNASGLLSVGAGSRLNIGSTSVANGTTFPSNFVAGNITLNATSTVAYQGNAAQTISNTPTSYGNVVLNTGVTGTTKTAGGALNIRGDLTINPSTTFAGGTSLTHLIGGSWTNTGVFSYTTGSTINFNGTAAQTISGSSASSFNNITISNTTAAVSLGSAQNMSGTLTVNAGATLALSTYTLGASTPPSTVNLYCGATGSTISGTAGSGTLYLGGNVGVTVSSGTGTGAVISAPVALGGVTRTFTVADETTSATDLTVSGVISATGAFGIIKAGAGTMVVSGSSTYTGTTTISAGTLKLGATGDATNTPLGTIGAGTVVSAGNVATLDLAGYTLGTAEALTLNGTGISSGGALMNSGSAAAYSGLITLGSASSIVGGTGTINVSNAGTITGATFGLTLGGAAGGTLASILGTTSGTLTKAGAGTWTVSGNSTYTGLTTISAGTLKLGAAGSGANTPLGTTGAGTTVSATGATLDLAGFTLATAEALTLNGTGIGSGGALMNSGSAASYSGLITLGSASSIVGGTGSINVSNTGTITGSGLGLTLGGAAGGTLASILGTVAGTLTKADAGTWILSGVSTFTGLTTVNAGTLKYGVANALATGAVTVNDGGTYDLNGFSDVIGALAVNSGTTGGTVTTGAGTLTLGGNVTSNGGGTNALISGNLALGATRTFTVTNSPDVLTVSAIISGATFGVSKLGSGTCIFTNPANTFTGATTVTAGELRLNPASTSATYQSQVILNGGTLSTTNIAAGTTLTSSTTLQLTNTSTIALGSNVHALKFANSNGVGWTSFKRIYVTGWTGTWTGGPSTSGQLFVGTAAGHLTAGQLGQILFFDGTNYYNAAQLSTGEVVPNGLFNGGFVTAVTGNWNDPVTWGYSGTPVEGFNYPGASNAVTISTGTTATVTANASCASMTVNAPATANGVTINSGISLTVSGAITMNSPTAAVTSAIAVGAGTLNAASIAIPGSVTGGYNCIVSLSTGTINVTNITFSGTPAQARLTFTDAGTINIGGNLGSGGTLTASAGTVVFNGSGAQNIGAYLTYYNLTINNATGPVVLSGTVTATRLLSMTNGTLDMANNNLTVGSLTGSGNLTHSTGTAGARTLTIGSDNTSPAAYTGVISNGTASSVALTKTGTGTLTLSGNNSYSGAVTISAGTLAATTIENAGTNSSLGTGSTTPAISIGATGVLKYTGTGHSTGRAITLTASGATIDASGSGAMTLSAGITGTNYNLVLTGTGSGTESGVIGTGSGTLTKTGTGTWTLSASNTYTGLTTISAGTLKLGTAGGGTNTPLGTVAAGTTVASGGVLDLNGYTLGTAEALTLNGTGISSGGALVNNAAATPVTYSGAITQGSAMSIGGTGNITLSSTITGGFGFTKAGPNTLTLGTGATVGKFTLNKGTLVSTSGTFNISSHFTNFGTFTHNGGTVNFNASGNVYQYLSGNATTFNNLTLGNTTNTMGPVLILEASAVVNATLGFSSTATDNQIISTVPGTKLTYLPATDPTYANTTTHYIDGTLERSFSTGTNVTRNFFIGNYIGGTPVASTPVSVTISSVTNAGTVAASATTGDHPNISTSGIFPSRSVNRYWTLTPGGGLIFNSYSATFTPLAADLDATATYGSFVVKRYSSGTWSTAGTPSYPGTPAITVSGVTAFSDFQIGNTNNGLYYKSVVTSGIWSATGTWNTSSDSSSWGAASAIPDYTARSITISTGNTVAINGAYSASNLIILGTLNHSAANTLSVNGYWINKGIYTGTNGTITFNGDLQTISGTSQTSFYNLTMNSTNRLGVYVGVVLSGVNATVTGALTLTNGQIKTGTNNQLILGSGASVTGASASSYVFGNLTWTLGTGTLSKTFDIGDSTSYTPVALTSFIVGTGGTLTARAKPGEHPNVLTSGFDPYNDVNRYWTLTPGGALAITSYTATFTFKGKNTLVDVDPVATTTNFIIKRYASSSWNATTAGTANPTNTSATGITAFGDFAIGEICTTPTVPTSGTATPSTICNGGFSVLRVTGGGGGSGGMNQTVAWYTGSCGGAFVGRTADSLNNLLVRPTVTTTYYGRYESGSPCNVNSSCVSVTVTVNTNTAPTITYNTDYCINGDGTVPVTITNSNILSVLWNNTGSASNPFIAPQAGWYTVTVTTTDGCSNRKDINIGNELIADGDFSEGNTGFHSDYTYYTGTMFPEGIYTVTKNARFFHTNFQGYDHTYPGTGLFLDVNGSILVGQVVWGQNVSVTPHTKYYFNAWATSMNQAGSYALLQFRVNGELLGTPFQLPPGEPATNPTGPFTWYRFYAEWNSGENTSADVHVVDLQTAAGGNDFGLDDISFSSLSPLGELLVNPSNAIACSTGLITLYPNIVSTCSVSYTYSWTGPGGYTSSLENPTLDPLTATFGTYSLLVTDNNLLTASGSTDVAYNRFTGATADWNTASNWYLNTLPGCSPAVDAIIPTGKFPVISNTGMTTNNLIIADGAQLTINAGKDLTACGCTKINGPNGLVIESNNANGNAAFIDNGTITYGTSGSANVKLYLTNPQGCLGCWHYVSMPVTSAYASVFNLDYMRYYNEPAGAWSPYITNNPPFPLTVMKGYAVSLPNVSPYNPETKLFDGHLNTGNQSASLTRNVPASTPPPYGGYGWNLVGNPYPSPINLESTGITWSANLERKVWYYSQKKGNYRPYVVGGPYGTAPATQFAPSMQGFFVHLTGGTTPGPDGTGTLSVSNAARVTSTDTTFYKDERILNDVLWLTASGNNDMDDIAVVYFRPDATSDFDFDFDAQKISGHVEASQLYTTATDGTSLTINALPFAGNNTVVPLEFSVETNGTGNYSISASRFESFRPGTTIILEDKKVNASQELTLNPVYNFSYADGDDPARFLLHFYNPYFGINNQVKVNDVLIYSYSHDVYLKDLTGNPEKGEFYLYNMMGQEIARKPVSDIPLNKYTFNLPNGYYIVRFITKDKTYTGKVYLD